MQIKIDKELCQGCDNKCLLYCPLQLRSLNAFNCSHCHPQKAACAAACPEKAFYQIAEGILAIDPELCTGCGKCIEACPEQAIEMVKGKAVKCDCCAGNNFSMACIKACPHEALSLEKSRQETRQIEGLLGWRVYHFPSGEISKKLEQKKDFEIVQTRNREKFFLLKLPEFSVQEARLLHNALEKFKSSPTGKKKITPEMLEKFLKEFCFFHQLELDEEQKQYLLKTLNSLVFSFGVVSNLLEKENLEEIALIGLGKEKPLYVFEKNYGWLKTNIYFCSERTVQDLINKMARNLGRRLSLQNPKLNATLNDGNRLNAIISPVAFTGPTFTIRKFRSKPFTPAELVSKNTFSAPALGLLWLAMQTDASLILAGNTGSGKTTSLNALFNFVPASERIIVTEETPEISLPHSHLIKLSETKELGASLNELIADTLRMRPDRVIVGEIRTAQEVSAFFDTLLAGQGKGSYLKTRSE